MNTLDEYTFAEDALCCFVYLNQTSCGSNRTLSQVLFLKNNCLMSGRIFLNMLFSANKFENINLEPLCWNPEYN